MASFLYIVLTILAGMWQHPNVHNEGVILPTLLKSYEKIQVNLDEPESIAWHKEYFKLSRDFETIGLKIYFVTFPENLKKLEDYIFSIEHPAPPPNQIPFVKEYSLASLGEVLAEIHQSPAFKEKCLLVYDRSFRNDFWALSFAIREEYSHETLGMPSLFQEVCGSYASGSFFISKKSRRIWYFQGSNDPLISDFLFEEL